MSDKFRKADRVTGDPDKLTSARAYSKRLQELGRSLVGGLYMLIRNVKLYDPENAIFVKPLEKFKDCVNTVLALENRLVLQGAGESFYVNDMLIRVEMKSADTLRFLMEEMERADVGGFQIEQPITTAEIRNFIFVFSKDNLEKPTERGVSGRKLQAMKLRRYEKLKEILQRANESVEEQQAVEEAKLDRKRYGLVVYARLVIFLSRYLAGLRGEGPRLNMLKAMHFIQDLVDVSKGHKSNFLGLSTLERGGETWCYHSANVAVLSILFGSELGLSKEWLRELGIAALYHDVGKADFDEELLIRHDDLKPGESQLLDKAPRFAVARFLTDNLLNKRTIQCLIAAHDHVIEFGEPLSDHRGETRCVRKKAELSTFTRIIAVVDCYDTLTSCKKLAPQLALTLMNTNLRHRFDQDLLRIFSHLMHGHVTRVFDGTGEKLSLF